jgi:hypothetical protein
MQHYVKALKNNENEEDREGKNKHYKALKNSRVTVLTIILVLPEHTLGPFYMHFHPDLT